MKAKTHQTIQTVAWHARLSSIAYNDSISKPAGLYNRANQSAETREKTTKIRVTLATLTLKSSINRCNRDN